MKISVIVPSYRRLSQLQECLQGLEKQVRYPDELIVIWRDSDELTGRWLQTWLLQPSCCTRKAAMVSVPGVAHAMESGRTIASGNVVAFIDDDAVPRFDWIERMEKYYVDSKVGGVGGKDIVYGNTEPPVESKKVGKVFWYGRLLGNHHLGVGSPMHVDILKGVNMSFRRELLEIPQWLSGNGAQVHIEVYVCLRIKSLGYDLIYDPMMLVDHFPAPRFDEDQRNEVVPKAIRDATYNLTVSMLAWLPMYRKVLRVIYGLLVGDKAGPGFVRFLVGLLKNDIGVVKAFVPSLLGQVEGVFMSTKLNKREHR